MTVSVGSVIKPATPNAANAGPIARIRSGSEPLVPDPPITKPTESDPWIVDRIDRLTRRPGSVVAVKVRLAAAVVTVATECVTAQVYAPALGGVAVTTNRGLVAPKIAVLFRYHWYVGAGVPEA